MRAVKVATIGVVDRLQQVDGEQDVASLPWAELLCHVVGAFEDGGRVDARLLALPTHEFRERRRLGGRSLGRLEQGGRQGGPLGCGRAGILRTPAAGRVEHGGVEPALVEHHE